MNLLDNEFPPDWEEPEDLKLPEELARHYKVCSCFKHTVSSASYLLKDIRTKRPVLLKTASDPILAQSLQNEKHLLDVIHSHTDSEFPHYFPTPLALETHEGTTFFLRTYIKGFTLDGLCETSSSRPCLTENQALSYAIDLTEQLQFLHSCTPPIIHRDIKPQNIVVDPLGKCHFIDMGISRQYDSGKKEDTFIMGTRYTSAPEQFGYQQTDARSDIYSMGVLLLYCLTGDYELTKENMEGISEPLQRIIKKATMFDPDQRYQDAGKLMEALLAVRFRSFPDAGYLTGTAAGHSAGTSLLSRRISLRAVLAVFLLCFVCLSACIAYGRGAFDFLTERHAGTDIYHFTEPLIEEAVSRQVQKMPYAITYDDLASITELNIFGEYIYGSDEEPLLDGDNYFFHSDAESHEAYSRIGSIRSLEDIAHMPNLQTLCLYHQQISDISVLKDTRISCLGLGYNPLTDLTPLMGNASIRTLNIPDLKLSDTKVLASLPNLTSLNISGAEFRSFEGMEGCPLTELDMICLSRFEDASSLAGLTCLQKLRLDSVTPDLMRIIRQFPLTSLHFFAGSGDLSFQDFAGMDQLQFLTFMGTDTAVCTLKKGNPSVSLPALESLELVHVRIEGFSFLENCENLKHLKFNDCEIVDYSGLNSLPGLESVECPKEERENIERANPGHRFTLIP